MVELEHVPRVVSVKSNPASTRYCTPKAYSEVILVSGFNLLLNHDFLPRGLKSTKTIPIPILAVRKYFLHFSPQLFLSCVTPVIPSQLMPVFSASFSIEHSVNARHKAFCLPAYGVHAQTGLILLPLFCRVHIRCSTVGQTIVSFSNVINHCTIYFLFFLGINFHSIYMLYIKHT